MKIRNKGGKRGGRCGLKYREGWARGAESKIREKKKKKKKGCERGRYISERRQEVQQGISPWFKRICVCREVEPCWVCAGVAGGSLEDCVNLFVCA